MQYIYKTGNWTVDTLNLSLYKHEQKIDIRPKTFSLLCIFLAHPQQILSKQTILEAVWDDVLVSDQVLFQTIRELRNIFEGTEVIKTVPRKGYCWLLEVNQNSLVNSELKPIETAQATNIAQTKQTPVQEKTINKPIILLGLIILALSVVTVLMIKQDERENVSGSVLVLPVQNKVIGNDHDWVSFGAMDQLINKLKPSDNIAVADLNYVMSSMKLANVQPEKWLCKY